MKKMILKIVPNIVIQLYIKYVYSKKKGNKFSGNNPYDTFKEIYKTNHWMSNESASGTGSNLEETKTLIKEISYLFKKLEVKTILDLPCGDFNWMQKVDLSGIKYIGADIVDELILRNKKEYAIENKIEFIQVNLINDILPKSDIIFNRDCLVHLSFADIFKSIRNIKSSGCKYLLTTTFPRHKINYDIVTGDWRAINLEKSPFNLPKPILMISENYNGKSESFKDKSLGLWLIDEIELSRKQN